MNLTARAHSLTIKYREYYTHTTIALQANNTQFYLAASTETAVRKDIKGHRRHQYSYQYRFTYHHQNNYNDDEGNDDEEKNPPLHKIKLMLTDSHWSQCSYLVVDILKI